MGALTSILFATTNPGKLREVRAALAGLPLELAPLTDYPDLPEAIEDGVTFEDNAKLKALHFASLVGGWTLADDSGLEIDALGGAPGVHSARYAGPGRDDAANNAKLIAELAGCPPEKRTARFRCVLALARPGEICLTVEGKVEGVIVDEAAGKNGFGYDPHFLVPSLGATMAQLAPERKNQISHRGTAVRALRPALERLLAGGQPAPPARGGT